MISILYKSICYFRRMLSVIDDCETPEALLEKVSFHHGMKPQQCFHLNAVMRIVDILCALTKGCKHRVCLCRSVVLFALLREAGRGPKLNIGVHSSINESSGHAWISIDGKPFLDKHDQHVSFNVVLHEKESIVFRTSDRKSHRSIDIG